MAVFSGNGGKLIPQIDATKVIFGLGNMFGSQPPEIRWPMIWGTRVFYLQVVAEHYK